MEALRRSFYSLPGIIALFVLLIFAVCADADEPKSLIVEHLMDIRGDFNQPTEVAVSSEGHVFVLDGANHRVAVFNENASLLYAFGRSGDGDGELKNPVGMDIDSQDTVYVADTGNQRIEVFNRQGRYLRRIDLSDWNARPVDVTVAADLSGIYVCDAKKHQILYFRGNGTFKSAWGDYGEDPGRFKFPGTACVDAKGRFFAVDILNGRVQIYDGEGNNPRQIGRLGILPGQFFRPKGVALDSKSRVFVSDSYTGIVQVFDANGGLYGVLSTGEGEFLRLTNPIGMAFDKKGRLYVVQAGLNMVSVYGVLD